MVALEKQVQFNHESLIADMEGGELDMGLGERWFGPMVGQLALVPRRHALDRTRRASDPEFTRTAAERNAVGSVLAQDRAIRRTEHRELLNIK